MKKFFFIASLLATFIINVNGQTKKDGTPDKRFNSNKQSSTYQTPTAPSTSKSSSRPIYNGQTHTTSHDGTYVGEQDLKTHKGGTYKNTQSNNKYGIHKTK